MEPRKEKKRKVITLDTKLEIVRRFESGESKANIGRALGFSESTVRAILSKARDYREKGKMAAASLSMKSTRNRNPLLVEMEDLLFIWLEDCSQKRIPVEGSSIRMKALRLFAALKDRKEQDDSTFSASKGWLENFKARSGLRNVRLMGEAVIANKMAAVTFPVDLQKMIEDGGYNRRQIFVADEVDLLWKKMPKFAAGKDRMTILLGCNAEGDCKLTPMVITRTGALKSHSRSLPVVLKSDQRVWVTRELFEEWFKRHFCPEVEKYCNDNNLDFKVLLILDDSPGHHKSTREMGENVRVVRLPPQTSGMLLPMDLGIGSAFKSHYIRRIFARVTTGNEVIALDEFWNNYGVGDAIENVIDSWRDVTTDCIRRSWRNLVAFPDTAFDDADRDEDDVIDELIGLGRDFGFGETEVLEFLESRGHELSIEDLLEIQLGASSGEDPIVVVPEETKVAPIEIPSAKLDELLETIEKAKEIIREIDPNAERSSSVRRSLDRQVECYRKIKMANRKSSSLTVKSNPHKRLKPV